MVCGEFEMSKKRGLHPVYDHNKIKQMILDNKKPLVIMFAVGCSYSVIRYVRNQMRRNKI